MSDADIQLMPVSSIDGTGGSVEAVATDAGTDPLRMIMEFFQRHWKWLLPLTAVMTLAGAILGYESVTVKYRSTGYIRIRPALPRVLFPTEQSGILPMFDAFVESQVTLITSQRVTMLAMENPAWKALGRGTGPEHAERFAGGLEVSRPRGAEVIAVAFTDPKREAAIAGAKAVIQAYENIYTEADGTQNAQTLQVLENRKTALTAELRSLNDQVMSIGNEFGSTSLGQIYDYKRTDLSKLESKLQQVEVAIALASGRQVASPPGTTQPVTEAAEMIALVDPEMREYLKERQAASRRLELLKLRFLPSHRDVIEAQAELNNVTNEIREYAERYRQRPTGSAVSPESGVGVESLEQLQERERNLTILVDKGRQSTLDLGRKRLQIDSLQAQIEEKRKRLAETDARLEQLSVESGVGGRLSVMTYGEAPISPYNDKRVQAAAGGAMGGAFMAIGLPLLASMANRRCRSIADAKNSTRRAGRLLGILPSLPNDLSDPEQAATAAHYVHHIRVLLQLGSGGPIPGVLAITSSASGSGKTSLTQALGLSFAASGARTLLIDCDIVGGGLTRRMMHMTSLELGQSLIRGGLISSRDLEEALGIAYATHRRLEYVLVERRLVTEDQVNRAAQQGEQMMVGLLDVLAGAAPADCITATGIKGLSVLPLGSARSEHIGSLSPEAIRRVFCEVRKSFDVVLIDTGPVPDSIEGSLVAAEADQVIMVVSRGEHRQPVQHAVDYLQSIGAKLAGVVFNRARPHDMQRSGYSSRVSQPLGELVAYRGHDGFARLGPVAQAVATVTQSSDHHERQQS